MLYKDDWFSWSYDGLEKSSKKNPTAKFEMHFKKIIHKPVENYFIELYKNAEKIRDIVNGKFDLLFSGGVDSEVILRVYKDLGVPLNVYIFKYENDLNFREYNQAIKVCENLNVKYKSIDFNLQKFFENDAYDIWTKCYLDTSARLPQLKMMEYLDNVPILGNGEPYWKKQSNGDWLFLLEESARFWSIYQTTIGRVALTDWYEYSPELIISHMELGRINDLISNRIPGKLSTVSHKCIIHKDHWSDIDVRIKLTGFEGNNSPSKESKPEYMLKFEQQYIKENFEAKIVKYTKDEIKSLLCSY